MLARSAQWNMSVFRKEGLLDPEEVWSLCTPSLYMVNGNTGGKGIHKACCDLRQPRRQF